MNTRQNILMIVGAAVVLAAVALFFGLQSKNKNSSVGTGVIDPTEQQVGNVSGGVPAEYIPAGGTISLGTSKGTVVVNNFYKNALGMEEGSAIILAQNASYNIDYSRVDGSFLLTIVAAPVAANQTAAENDLLKILGVGKPDVCRLTASVIVLSSADAQAAGKIRPLSFCSQIAPTY